jgi:hypothetical protein
MPAVFPLRPAMAILLRLKRQALEWGVDHVISYRVKGKAAPRHVKNPRGSFARMLRELGLTGQYKFHHTKAAFVTSVALKNSGPVTQAPARHKDFATTARYLVVVDKARREAVEAILNREATAGLDLSSSLGAILQPRRGSPTQKSHTGVLFRPRSPQNP